jgi:hypothetical protein
MSPEPSSRVVVVSGVSSGIGLATARELVSRGYRVFGTVRRSEDARRVRAELGEGFQPLQLDVCDEQAVAAAVQRVRRALGGAPLAGLVNNAGTTVLGPLTELDTAALRRQFEANLFGLFEMTRRFLPLLRAPVKGASAGSRPGQPGRIVNISSVSGCIAYPFFGAYAASKHAVEGLSDALRRELLPWGVAVILIEPGIVDTPLVEKSLAQAGAFREGEYAEAIAATLAAAGIRRGAGGGRGGPLPVQRVVQAILSALESRRPRLRYVIPQSWLKGWILPRLLPARLVDRAVARALRLRRGDLADKPGG